MGKDQGALLVHVDNSMEQFKNFLASGETKLSMLKIMSIFPLFRAISIYIK